MQLLLKISFSILFAISCIIISNAQKIVPNRLPDNPDNPPPIVPIEDEREIRVDTTTSAEVRAMLVLMKNKEKYIGKPFSVLLKDLPKPIVKYVNHIGVKYMDPSSGIMFSSSSSFSGSLYRVAVINVFWQTPIEMEAFRPLVHLKPWQWCAEVEAFFAPRIITDFEIGEPWIVSKYGGWLRWERRDKTKTINQLLKENLEE